MSRHISDFKSISILDLTFDIAFIAKVDLFIKLYVKS